MGVVVLDKSDLEALSRGELIKVETNGEEVIGLVTDKFLEDGLEEKMKGENND